MAVTGMSFCDFVCLKSNGITVERIKFEKKLWQDHMYPKVEALYLRYLLPKLTCPENVVLAYNNVQLPGCAPAPVNGQPDTS